VISTRSTIDFDGVDALFLLAVVSGFAAAFVAAVATAGVRRIVFQSTSAIDDDVDMQPNDIAALHHDIEQIIIGSGLEYVFLRLDVASSDPLQWAFDVPRQLAQGDVVRGPYADAATSPIHPADFAAVAVAALTTGAYVGQALHVTGPVSLTHAEQIALIGAAHGRTCATRSSARTKRARRSARTRRPICSSTCGTRTAANPRR
jgi:uncharacterized protein YbjT (DUF2867 family)